MLRDGDECIIFDNTRRTIIGRFKFRDDALCGNKIMRWAPNNICIAFAGDDGRIRIIDINIKRSKRMKHASSINSLDWSSNGINLLVVDNGGIISVWHVATGQLVYKIDIEGYQGWIGEVALSMASEGIVSVSDGIPTVWSTISGKKLGTLAGQVDLVHAIGRLFDNKYIVIGSNGNTLLTWNIWTRQSLRTFEGHTGAISAASISPNGRYIISASDDKTIRVWDVISGKELYQFVGHSARVDFLRWTSDGEAILSGSVDGKARKWQLNGSLSSNSLTGADVAIGRISSVNSTGVSSIQAHH